MEVLDLQIKDDFIIFNPITLLFSFTLFFMLFFFSIFFF